MTTHSNFDAGPVRGVNRFRRPPHSLLMLTLGIGLIGCDWDDPVAPKPTPAPAHVAADAAPPATTRPGTRPAELDVPELLASTWPSAAPPAVVPPVAPV